MINLDTLKEEGKRRANHLLGRILDLQTGLLSFRV